MTAYYVTLCRQLSRVPCGLRSVDVGTILLPLVAQRCSPTRRYREARGLSCGHRLVCRVCRDRRCCRRRAHGQRCCVARRRARGVAHHYSIGGTTVACCGRRRGVVCRRGSVCVRMMLFPWIAKRCS